MMHIEQDIETRQKIGYELHRVKLLAAPEKYILGGGITFNRDWRTLPGHGTNCTTATAIGDLCDC